MLKTILKQITQVGKGKLNKLGLEEKIAKHPDYIAKAKEIFSMINKNLRISDTVENKLIPKVEKFEKALLAKFPELTKDDVVEIKQSIVEEFEAGNEPVLSKVDDLKQLQDFNTKLQEENEKLKSQLSKFQSIDDENVVTATTETSIDNYNEN